MDENDLPTWARGARQVPIIGRVTDDGVVVLRQPWPPRRRPEDKATETPSEGGRD